MRGDHLMIKRIFAAALTALLLLGGCCNFAYAAAPFSYSSAQDARLKALDCFMTCAFSVEYSGDKNNVAKTLTRWENTIKICVTGSPAYDDLRQLDRFIMDVATHCPNMPNIRLVNSERDANITVYYGPLKELGKHLDIYREGNWGAFSYTYSGGRMVSAKVAIATDVNWTESKRHLLMEELVGTFGLTNDHYVYSDSIVYQEWTTVGELSEVDWLMLNMLYDPDLRCGMSAKTAYDILRAKILS